jgi:hypothetical protein
MLLAVLRRLCLVAMVTPLAGYGLWAPSTGAATRAGTAPGAVCGPGPAHTLARDAVARVYSSAGNACGCVAGGARSYKLGTTGFCIGAERLQTVRVAGRLAAYSLQTCGIDTGNSTINVRNLRTGAVLVQRPATTKVGVEGFQSIDSLVVKADGAVAWIATANSIGKPTFVRQLQRLDTRGFAVLDSGRDVNAASLRLDRSRLSWKHATAVRTATLR